MLKGSGGQLLPRLLLHPGADAATAPIRALPSPLRALAVLPESPSRHRRSRRGFSTASRRSPYAVLNLRTHATKDAIKSAFRKLAKEYHPDLSRGIRPLEESERLMAELIEAYDALMDDGFGGRVGDSRVALACEMYAVEELRLDRLHDVHDLRIEFEDDGDEILDGVFEKDEDGEPPVPPESLPSSSDELSPRPVLRVSAHPRDSVSDLKRSLQSLYGDDWGLFGRRTDRDGLAMGWELVAVARADGGGANSDPAETMVMGYHLFLSDYGIRDGDVVHAVVRRHEGDDREASTAASSASASAMATASRETAEAGSKD